MSSRTADDEPMSVREVNETLELAGFDPGAIRAFARELVAQEMLAPLEGCSRVQRCMALYDRVEQFIRALLAAGANRRELAEACEGAAIKILSGKI